MTAATAGRRLSSGLGVNFSDNARGTYVFLSYRGEVLDFQCAEVLPSEEREGICDFIEKQPLERYFPDGEAIGVDQSSTKPVRVLIDDLKQAGFPI